MAAWGIFILVILVFILSAVTIYWIIVDGDQRLAALWIGIIFVGMAAVVDLYRKHFVPDEMVDKVRLRKVVPRREFK
jgi:hypothetical protein